MKVLFRYSKLPEWLYQRLKASAEQHQHSIEDEALDVLTASLTAADQLPADLAAASAVRSQHLYVLRGTLITYFFRLSRLWSQIGMPAPDPRLHDRYLCRP